MCRSRSLLGLSLLVLIACGEDPGEGDDLPPGAFTSGPVDSGNLDASESGSTGPDPTTSAGTTTTGDTASGDTTSGSAEESTGLPDMIGHEEHILPLWLEACSSNTSCHDADNPQAGLDLASEGIYTRICEGAHPLSGMPYIDCVGFDPNNSYIFRKMDGSYLDGDISGASGLPMPPTKDDITDYDLALIEAWIEQGAMP